MGMFSWHTNDTKKVIWIDDPYLARRKKPPVVYLIDDKGNKWREDSYKGYGEFGGKDFYDLLAEMNGLEDRVEGVHLAFSGDPYLSPNLVSNPNRNWKNVAPKNHEGQGWCRR